MSALISSKRASKTPHSNWRNRFDKFNGDHAKLIKDLKAQLRRVPEEKKPELREELKFAKLQIRLMDVSY